jgi:hypothetical protein|tara:strand:- start:4273 stop:4983 length:711 start_codon:yes stop_codon:yes gene_type:complete
MALPKVTAPTYELELPSTGKKIKYRPFLVKEEKVLLIAMDSKDEKQIQQALIDTIKTCVITRGVKPDELPSFDLEYLFLRIRAASVGEEITLNVKCMDDGKTEVSHTVNINEIEVVKPEDHSDKIMINDDVGIIMKYPSLNHFVNTQFTKSAADDGMNVIVSCIDQIFEGEDITEAKECTKKELTSFLESLTQEQFNKISDFFRTMPKLSHTFEIENPNTKKKSTYTIEGLQSFFG